MSVFNDLIRRLREFIPPAGVPREITDYEVMFDEAAALIEQQAARIAELEQRLVSVGLEVGMDNGPGIRPAGYAAIKRAETAERELAAVREAMPSAAAVLWFIEKLPVLDLDWPQDIQNEWCACVNRLADWATKIERAQTTAQKDGENG